MLNNQSVTLFLIVVRFQTGWRSFRILKRDFCVNWCYDFDLFYFHQGTSFAERVSLFSLPIF